MRLPITVIPEKIEIPGTGGVRPETSRWINDPVYKLAMIVSPNHRVLNGL
jgi:hypothetical protein